MGYPSKIEGRKKSYIRKRGRNSFKKNKQKLRKQTTKKKTTKRKTTKRRIFRAGGLFGRDKKKPSGISPEELKKKLLKTIGVLLNDVKKRFSGEVLYTYIQNLVKLHSTITDNLSLINNIASDLESIKDNMNNSNGDMDVLQKQQKELTELSNKYVNHKGLILTAVTQIKQTLAEAPAKLSDFEKKEQEIKAMAEEKRELEAKEYMEEENREYLRKHLGDDEFAKYSKDVLTAVAAAKEKAEEEATEKKLDKNDTFTAVKKATEKAKAEVMEKAMAEAKAAEEAKEAEAKAKAAKNKFPFSKIGSNIGKLITRPKRAITSLNEEEEVEEEEKEEEAITPESSTASSFSSSSRSARSRSSEEEGNVALTMPTARRPTMATARTFI